MSLLLAAMLTQAAHAKDVLHITTAHDWSQRLSRNAGEMGSTFKVDVGYGKGIGIGKLIPEVGIGLAYNRGVIIPRVGLRAVLGWVIQPGAYAHVNAALAGPFGAATGFDTGVTLHLQLPYIRVGGFAGVQFFGGRTGPDIPDRNAAAGLELIFALPINRDKS